MRNVLLGLIAVDFLLLFLACFIYWRLLALRTHFGFLLHEFVRLTEVVNTNARFIAGKFDEPLRKLDPEDDDKKEVH